MDCQWLKHITPNHDEWVRIARYLQANNPEDVVQEMYIALCKYASLEKANKGYIFLTIRSLVIKDWKQSHTHADIADHEYHLTDDDDPRRNQALERLSEKITATLSEKHPYYKWMYETYTHPDYNSMRKIEEATNISLRTIHRDINKLKNEIRDKHNEDYQDLNNGDYERI